METLREIQLASRPQSSGSPSLVTQLTRHVPDAQAEELLDLMEQTQAGYPNQTLPPLTPDMYLAQWEEIVVEFGMPAFRAALWRAICESDFFPGPKSIRNECELARRKERERARTTGYLTQLQQWKEQWERERAEDRAQRDGREGVTA